MQIGYYAIFDYNEYDEKEEALKLNTLTMQVYELPKMTPLKDINLKDNEKAFYISYNTEDTDLSEFTFYRIVRFPNVFYIARLSLH